MSTKMLMAERVNGILKQEFLLDRLQDPLPLAKRKVKEAVASTTTNACT